MEALPLRQEFYSNDYFQALLNAQKRLSRDYPDLFGKVKDFSAEEQEKKMASYITNFVAKYHISVSSVPDSATLAYMFFLDMVKYSALTTNIESPEDLNEEVDVNGWNDVEVIHRDGTKEKTLHFCNPDHAEMVLARMAQVSGGKLDEAFPLVESDLPNNTRFVAMKYPIIPANDRIAASIRIVRPAAFEEQFFLDNGTITPPELRLLKYCLEYGVPILYIGETSSGKTTLMNCICRAVPDSYRHYSIETGSRELCIKKRDPNTGAVLNDVVSTISRLSDDPKLSIDQDRLLDEALRFNPDIIEIGEMRGIESAAAVEAALTDHTVTSSLHAPNAETAHIRIAQLYCKRYPIDINVAMQMAAQAFPLVVALRCLRNHKRHVMSITECVTHGLSGREYRPLYRYHVTSNIRVGDKYKVTGVHEMFNDGLPSETLISKMQNKGLLDDELDQLAHPEDVSQFN